MGALKNKVGRPPKLITVEIVSASLPPDMIHDMKKSAEFLGIKSRSKFIQFLFNFWKESVLKK